MRVALVSPYWIRTPGGVSAYVSSLARALGAQGCEVTVLSPDIAPGADGPASVVRVAGSTRFGQALSVWRRLSALRPDVVHVHGFWYLLLGARLHRKMSRRCALVATQHTLPARRYPWLKRRVESALFRGCDAMALPVRAALATLRDVGGVDLPEHCEVVGTAPAAPFSAVNERPRSAADPVLGTIAVLVYPEKLAGVLDLVEAMPALLDARPGTRLRVVGGTADGSGERVVAERAEALGLSDRVEITGLVKNPWGRLEDLSVYVQSSRRDTLSLALLEAMARGIPVVAADVGGVREVVTDGVDGLIFPAGDVRALAERLVRLVRDERFSQEIAARALHTIASGFTWEAVARRHVALYESLGARRP
jgi:glycosyltransferase involved in cell wall biosynthesis